MNVTDAAMKAAKKGQNEGAMPNVAIKTAERQKPRHTPDNSQQVNLLKEKFKDQR